MLDVSHVPAPATMCSLYELHVFVAIPTCRVTPMTYSDERSSQCGSPSAMPHGASPFMFAESE